MAAPHPVTVIVFLLFIMALAGYSSFLRKFGRYESPPRRKDG